MASPATTRPRDVSRPRGGASPFGTARPPLARQRGSGVGGGGGGGGPVPVGGAGGGAGGGGGVRPNFSANRVARSVFDAGEKPCCGPHGGITASRFAARASGAACVAEAPCGSTAARWRRRSRSAHTS